MVGDEQDGESHFEYNQIEQGNPMNQDYTTGATQYQMVSGRPSQQLHLQMPPQDTDMSKLSHESYEEDQLQFEEEPNIPGVVGGNQTYQSNAS